jgi:hypothetical protein
LDYVLNMQRNISPQARILHRLAGVAGLKLKEVSALLDLPHNTFLQIIQGRRPVQPALWQRARLLMGLESGAGSRVISGEEPAREIFKDLMGRPYCVGFLQWWQEKALPYLSAMMAKKHPGPRGQDIPPWPDNEAKLLLALLRAAEKKNRLPVAANVIRRALTEAASTLHLEKEWEHEAQAAGVKDIRYCISPVDLDKAPLPSVSVSAQQWKLSASPVPITGGTEDCACKK